jgi:hypothetical protein
VLEPVLGQVLEQPEEQVLAKLVLEQVWQVWALEQAPAKLVLEQE